MQKNIKYLTFFFFLLILLPSVSATRYFLENSTIRNTNLNINLNITPFNFSTERLYLKQECITFYHLNYTNPNADYNFSFNETFNWTATNLNITLAYFPYVDGYNLYNGLNQTIFNQTAHFNITDCGFSSLVYYSADGHYNQNPPLYSCGVNDTRIDNLTLENGTNYIILTYPSTPSGGGSEISVKKEEGLNITGASIFNVFKTKSKKSMYFLIVIMGFTLIILSLLFYSKKKKEGKNNKRKETFSQYKSLNTDYY